MKESENSILDLFEQLFEEIMVFISKDEFKDEVKRAHNVYIKGLSDDIIELGFNEWLVFDYNLKNGKSFIDKFANENDLDLNKMKLLESMKKSVFSAFKVMKNSKNKFLKDIFTKMDYKIEDNLSQQLVIARLINYENVNYIFNLYKEWEETSEDSIKKSILKKYNEYCSNYNNISIDDFIKNNTVALYKYLMIYKDIEIKSVFQDEEFFVYQGKYLISNYEKFINIINNTDKIVFQTDEFDSDIYELYSEGIVLSEIEVIKDKIALECRSKEELDTAMEIINELFNDVLVKIGEEVLNVEDLI